MTPARRLLMLALFLSPCGLRPLALAQVEAGPMPGQLPTLTPRTHEERERRYQAQHRITLNVEVFDGQGTFVSGLRLEDFTLLDNGQARKIDAVRAVESDLPAAHVHAILILDTLNTTSKNIVFERKGIEKFLARNHSHLDYSVAVAVLSKMGLGVSHPSRDGNELISDLERLSQGARAVPCAEEVGDGGSDKVSVDPSVVGLHGQIEIPTESKRSRLAACENARFKLSVSQLNKLAREEADALGRAIVIWVGRGWPLLSGLEFAPDTRSLKQSWFDYRVELATALRESQITLHAIAFPDKLADAEPHGDADRALIHGVASEEQASAASMALPVLVHETGGLSLDFSEDIADSIATCLGDAKAFYALTFDSSPALTSTEYHAIEVRVSQPGLKVRTNSSYYAQP